MRKVWRLRPFGLFWYKQLLDEENYSNLRVNEAVKEKHLEEKLLATAKLLSRPKSYNPERRKAK